MSYLSNFIRASAIVTYLATPALGEEIQATPPKSNAETFNAMVPIPDQKTGETRRDVSFCTKDQRAKFHMGFRFQAPRQAIEAKLNENPEAFISNLSQLFDKHEKALIEAGENLTEKEMLSGPAPFRREFKDAIKRSSIQELRQAGGIPFQFLMWAPRYEPGGCGAKV